MKAERDTQECSPGGVACEQACLGVSNCGRWNFDCFFCGSRRVLVSLGRVWTWVKDDALKTFVAVTWGDWGNWGQAKIDGTEITAELKVHFVPDYTLSKQLELFFWPFR